MRSFLRRHETEPREVLEYLRQQLDGDVVPFGYSSRARAAGRRLVGQILQR
jgi:hypothetical protein